MCSIREVVCPKRELGLGREKRSPGERDDATTTTIGVFHYKGRVSGGREFRLGREKEERVAYTYSIREVARLGGGSSV